MSDKALILAAAHVAHRAAPEWAQFISAFTAYADGKRDELVASNPDTLQVAQGRAQACAALRKLLSECTTTAENIEKRNQQKPHSPR